MSDRSASGSESRKRKSKHLIDYSSTDDSYGNHGRWTAEEHQLFLESIHQFGREWDKVQSVVKSRSLAQVRSHAQKYFLKLSKNEEMEKLNEFELWQSCHGENATAVMVLDLMGSILKKLKTKREEILAGSGYSTHQDLCSNSNSSNNSHCDAKSDLDSHHENDRFDDLQKAIEQLDAKTYNDVVQVYDEKRLESETDHEDLTLNELAH